MTNFGQLADAIIDCDIAKTQELTKKAVEQGDAALDIINKGLLSGMNVVGQRFKKGDMYVPEVMMAAKAMNSGMDIVKPLLTEGESFVKGKILIATVAGDLHDIGKNLVAMMMESSSLAVVDLGVDVPPDKIVEAVQTHKPDLLGLSALLTTTMLAMKDTIDELKENNLTNDIKIIVGGAPVTQSFADEIGADGWAPDAASAKDLALDLLNS